jgi:hypothetical protein
MNEQNYRITAIFFLAINKGACVDFRRYTDCWSTGWGSEVFPDANIPTFYSDALRLVYTTAL